LKNFRAACFVNLDGFHLRVSMNPEGGMGQVGKSREQGTGNSVKEFRKPT
jgi:hypothetical protein